jgi:hypothetical protein
MRARICAALLVASLSPSAHAEEDWQKQARRLLGSDREQDVEAGARLCLTHDSEASTELLCRLIAKPPRDLRALRSAYAAGVAEGNAPLGLGLPSGQRPRYLDVLPQPKDGGRTHGLALKINARMARGRSAARVLARLRSAGARRWLLERGLKHRSWRVRAECAAALGASADGDDRESLEALVSDRQPAVRSMAVDALAKLRERASGAAIEPALADQAWQVRLAAVKALVAIDALSSTGALIARLEAEQGRLLSELDAALQALTGQRFDADPEAWRAFYEANRERFEKGTYVRPRKRRGATVPRTVESHFFGIPVDSKRALFVIDYSKSMNQPFPRDEHSDGRPVSGLKKGEVDLRVTGATRIAEAQEQALRALFGLPTDALFGLLVYHYGVDALLPKMLRAGTKPKTLARGALLTAELGLGTNIFDALDRAFDITGSGRFEKNYEAPVDTIYFLSDGAPTSGRCAEPSKIIEAVVHWNRLRKLRIHTVLIRGDEGQGQGPARGRKRQRSGRAARFMAELARRTGGVHVNRDSERRR